MPKKNSSGVSPLSHYWVPPEGLIESGVGEPWACLTATYEFDAAFFETELLPRFLGLKFDHTENEPSFLVEREEALSLAMVAVLVDQSRFDSTQTTMRWYQLPVHVPGGIQHAKVSLLAWEKLVRVIVGSANLTRRGYRRNREVFAALDFWDDSNSVPLGLLGDILDLLMQALEWSRAAPTVLDRTAETIERVRRTARNWTEAPTDFTPRERPRVSLAVTQPATNRRPARSTLDDVVASWGNRRAVSVCVVTPFVGQHQAGASRDAVIDKILDLSRSRDCEGWLVIPEMPRTEKEQKVHVPIPDVFGRCWTTAFGSPRSAYVLPLPLCVEEKEDRNRDLHSKAILLEGEEDVLLMIGSSNFTPHGMGVGARNLEANLVIEDRANERRGGIALADRLQLPLGWESAVDPKEVVWQDPAELPEDSPEPAKCLPPFFAWATYSQKTGVLTLMLDRTKAEPSGWSVRLPGASGDTGLLLFSRDTALKAEGLVTYTLPEDARGVNIVALTVEWIDSEGETRHARLGVCTESPDSLLPPSEFRKLTADTIIACLISGKSPSAWYDQQQNRSTPGGGNDAAIESLRAVDTSGYLLYRVRQFGRAVTGMCERVVHTMPRPDAIRYRLFKDPFGPMSLASTIVAAEGGDNHGWCAQLETEHRVFLLTEIVLAVGHLRQRFHKSTRGKDRKDLMACFDEAETTLANLLDNELTRSDAEVPANLSAYVTAVRGRMTKQSAVLAEEVEDAG
jgi:hypothetical protein